MLKTCLAPAAKYLVAAILVAMCVAFAFQPILQLAWNSSPVVSIDFVVGTVEVVATSTGRGVHGTSYRYGVMVGDRLVFLQDWQIRRRGSTVMLRRINYENGKADYQLN
ncbi:hypothetical protein EDC40_106182 [Aminobacter aminovorans]|uniref:Uncharacterized protein n=1 Tax=Aminobacter aminovorans TaxID=83263 RepID=A0A380WFQ6_AMIAI|nr:hypothetical protein [Aminobacter aminovorans]TCS25386.1 hypothetical protein EDC40_106182 [Aminobacter aminovorans]SUU87036.1 Uncharacterised protein [Aminobacter aminovorans]